MKKIIYLVLISCSCLSFSKDYELLNCSDSKYDGKKLRLDISDEYTKFNFLAYSIKLEKNSRDVNSHSAKTGHLFVTEKSNSISDSCATVTSSFLWTNCLGSVMQNSKSGENVFEIDLENKLFFWEFVPHIDMNNQTVSRVSCDLD